MSVIPDSFKNSVVSIGVDFNNITSWIGSGFFIGKKVNDAQYEVYLVSNQHVLSQSKLYKIRMIDKITNNVQEYSLSLKENINLFFHPNLNVDIGIVVINGSYISEHIKDFALIDIDSNAYSSTEYLANGGSSGDLCYMIGFPMGLVVSNDTEPICRLGCVARFSQSEIKTSSSFLVDINNFPGNSGSPLFLRPEILSIQGTKNIDKCILIGVVKSYIPYEEKLLNMQTGKVVEVKSENSGIALATPIEYLKDVVDIIHQKKEGENND